MRSTRDLALLLLSSGALAQTFTDCDPTKETCKPDNGIKDYHYSVDFTKGESPHWIMTYNEAKYDGNGAGLTISNFGMAPTMQSDFYIHFGVISFIARAAPGAGIISSVILESDCLDEIDWEWLGGDAAQVQTNYFGKGNTTTYDRGTYESAPDNQNTAHNYTLVWTPEYTQWVINGAVVRTLNFADAVGGANYPQTPSRIKLGNWIAADTKNQGTIDWAGGVADFSKGPFTMFVERIDITNYNPATKYVYGDKSGTWQSIVKSNETISDEDADPLKPNTPITEESNLPGDDKLNQTSSTVAPTTTKSTTTVSSTLVVSATNTASGPSDTGAPSTPSTPETALPPSFAVKVGPTTGAIMAMLSFAFFLV